MVYKLFLSIVNFLDTFINSFLDCTNQHQQNVNCPLSYPLRSRKLIINMCRGEGKGGVDKRTSKLKSMECCLHKKKLWVLPIYCSIPFWLSATDIYRYNHTHTHSGILVDFALIYYSKIFQDICNRYIYTDIVKNTRQNISGIYNNILFYTLLGHQPQIIMYIVKSYTYSGVLEEFVLIHNSIIFQDTCHIYLQLQSHIQLNIRDIYTNILFYESVVTLSEHGITTA